MRGQWKLCMLYRGLCFTAQNVGKVFNKAEIHLAFVKYTVDMVTLNKQTSAIWVQWRALLAW